MTTLPSKAKRNSNAVRHKFTFASTPSASSSSSGCSGTETAALGQDPLNGGHAGNRQKDDANVPLPLPSFLPDFSSLLVGRDSSHSAAAPAAIGHRIPQKRSGTGGDWRHQRPIPKKISFQSFKVAPALPEAYERTSWERLQAAVLAIYSSVPVPDSMQQLLTCCEILCQYKKAVGVYEKLSALIHDHCHKLLQACLNAIPPDISSSSSSSSSPHPSAASFLAFMAQTWTTYCQQSISLHNIFFPLDRTYVLVATPIGKRLKLIWDLSVDAFRDIILLNTSVKCALLDSLIILIRAYRIENKLAPIQSIKQIVTMLSDCSMYSGEFEMPRFLPETRSHYAKVYSERSADEPLPIYLAHVQFCLEMEEGMCSPEQPGSFLLAMTKRSVIELVERELLAKHADQLLAKPDFKLMLMNDTGLNQGVDERTHQQLALLYRLYMRVGAADALKKAFSTVVKTFGTEFVCDPAKDAEMIVSLLKYKLKLESIVNGPFRSDEGFTNLLKDCFQSFINTRADKPAELLARHIDTLLRGKGKTDAELEYELDRCLSLFRFIQGKDIFEAFYKKDLSKRMLLGRSSSLDAEKSMLAKLKGECGAGFTSKLESMFKDMDLSHDVMQDYKASRRSSSSASSSDIDLSVSILTAGCWPTQTGSPCVLPDHMTSVLDAFSVFYIKLHHGRKLTWQHSLSTCVLKSFFPKGVKEITMSTYQALILLLFNRSPSLTYAEIEDQSKLEKNELIRSLQSLACGKVRILIKSSKGKDISPSDSFTFNQKFENPLSRIKVNSVQLKEVVIEEREQTQERVFEDRQYLIDAALVRIMKSRRTCSLNELMSDLLAMMQFPLRASDVKLRIESLIERDFMERDAKDAKVYKYIA